MLCIESVFSVLGIQNFNVFRYNENVQLRLFLLFIDIYSSLVLRIWLNCELVKYFIYYIVYC